MRLMTCLAAFKAQWSVFKRERPTLVAVAFEASRIISSEGLQHSRPDAAMRIVAIHASHVAFGKLVMERPLELGPRIEVATSALLVDRIGLANHHRHARMYFMAGRTRNLIVGVAAFEQADMGRRIQMTVKTDFVSRGRRQLPRILD